MNDHDGSLPPSIRAWIGALVGEITWTEVRRYLAPDVVHSIGGRATRGADHVVALMEGRARSLGGVLWTAVQQPEQGGRVVIRGIRPGSALPGPGGPMSALDFEFSLAPGGLIVEVSPKPHHLEPPDLQAPLSIGARIQPFELMSLDGRPVPVDPAQTDFLLVMFTCNHCPWALGWHDRLQAVVRDYRNPVVEILQVNANDASVSPFDTTDRSRERVSRREFSGPYLSDPGQRVARAWGARHTPELFLFAAPGTLAYHGAPDADFQDETCAAGWLRQALDAALAGRPAPTPRTAPIGCTIKWTL